MKLPLILLLSFISAHLFSQTYYNTHNGTGDIVNGNKIVNNTYSGTSKSAVSENYNTNYEDKDCGSKKCGDVCFLNKTTKKISVGFNYSYVTINPGEANCFYQVASGPLQYNANLDPDNRIMNPANPSGSDQMRSAQVFVEQCKSKTVVIQ